MAHPSTRSTANPFTSALTHWRQASNVRSVDNQDLMCWYLFAKPFSDRSQHLSQFKFGQPAIGSNPAERQLPPQTIKQCPPLEYRCLSSATACATGHEETKYHHYWIYCFHFLLPFCILIRMTLPIDLLCVMLAMQRAQRYSAGVAGFWSPQSALQRSTAYLTWLLHNICSVPKPYTSPQDLLSLSRGHQSFSESLSPCKGWHWYESFP